MNLNPETDVAYVAYTGKAATVLQTKGCPNATTAHKLLYEAKPRPNGTFYLKNHFSVSEEEHKTPCIYSRFILKYA